MRSFAANNLLAVPRPAQPMLRCIRCLRHSCSHLTGIGPTGEATHLTDLSSIANSRLVSPDVILTASRLRALDAVKRNCKVSEAISHNKRSIWWPHDASVCTGHTSETSVLSPADARIPFSEIRWTSLKSEHRIGAPKEMKHVVYHVARRSLAVRRADIWLLIVA